MMVAHGGNRFRAKKWAHAGRTPLRSIMADDPFAQLGLPRTFDLTSQQIETAYLRRVTTIHPDTGIDLLFEADHSGRGVDSDAASARLNAARDVIANPELRAGALLLLLGGPGKEQDRSLPEGFLPWIMEIREDIESQIADPAAVAKWRTWALEQQRAYQARVGKLFASVSQRVDPGVLIEIRRELNAWRYIERLLEQLESPG